MSSKTKVCEAPHGHLLRHFTLLCACSSHIQREATSPSPSLLEQRSRAQLPLNPPLREHSQPQTALHKPKSANPWRSLVFWLCSGETRASQCTDIIPGARYKHPGRGMPKASCLFRWVCQYSGLFGLDCTFWWMLLQLSPPAMPHLSKTRILSCIPDGQSYFRKVSDSRSRVSADPKCDPVGSQSGHQWCVTQVVVLGTQRKIPHGGVVPETRIGTGQTEGPLGPAGAISHEEQQPPWKHQPFPNVPPLPITASWGRRQEQSTFRAAEGKHNQKMQLLWSASKQLAGPFVNGFLLWYHVSLSPELLWGWQFLTEIQHIPQPHSLRSDCVCQATRSMWQFAAEHTRFRLLSLFFSLP